ncbi:MAG: hypothetical protein ACYSWP_07990 [Planctomycetota bacterium]|jgi:hypothetical protein
MVNLSDEAKKLLDNYLQEVRVCLEGCTRVDSDEVRQNITEHVEAELAGCDEPVSTASLGDVLDKLGSPEQWIPEEELPWWRKMVCRLQMGPDDWWLGYISFGLLLWFLYLVRSITLPEIIWLPLVILNSPAVGILFWLSFLLARAVASEGGKKLGAQKWILYPQLILMYLGLAAYMLLPILLLPILRFGPGFYTFFQKSSESSGNAYWFSLLMLGIPTGIGWALLGLLFMLRPNFLSFLFRPFFQRRNQSLGWILIAAGLVLEGICVSFYVFNISQFR